MTQELLKHHAKKTVQIAQHVSICKEALEKFCTDTIINVNHWLNVSPYSYSHFKQEQKLAYLFLFNAMSFSYWGNSKWTIQRNGELIDGSFALLTCLGEAFDTNPNLSKPSYLAKITLTELEIMTRGNIALPLLEERCKHVQEIGTLIEQRFKNSFICLINKAEGDANKLFRLIINNFASFSDVSYYHGRILPFYKRAQLLVSDIAHAFPNEISIMSLNEFTACADYKLPLVLRRYGILVYSDELTKKIMRKEELLKESLEEIEIRASTICAVELITERLRKKNKDIIAMDVNDYLWLEGQKKLPGDEPYHRTRTTDY